MHCTVSTIRHRSCRVHWCFENAGLEIRFTLYKSFAFSVGRFSTFYLTVQFSAVVQYSITEQNKTVDDSAIPLPAQSPVPACLYLGGTRHEGTFIPGMATIILLHSNLCGLHGILQQHT